MPSRDVPNDAALAERRGPSPSPDRLADTGLTGDFVRDLLLKTLYVQGTRTGQQLAEFVALPFALIDDELLTLQQRRFIEVRGTHGPNRGSYIFDLVGDGPRPRQGGASRPASTSAPRRCRWRSTASGWPSSPSSTPTSPRMSCARASSHLVLERRHLRHAGPGGQLVQVHLPLRRTRATARRPSPRPSRRCWAAASSCPTRSRSTARS